MMHSLGGVRPELPGDDCYIADNATLIGDVHLGAGVSIWFGAVVRGDNDRIEIGGNSNIQDGAILHTDPGIVLEIGNGVTVGHRAVLHGCRIGDGSLIGIGSTILNNAVVGRHCLVGAHALITEGKTFPDGMLILGAPARAVRELDDAERRMLEASANLYVAKIARYRAGLAAAGYESAR